MKAVIDRIKEKIYARGVLILLFFFILMFFETKVVQAAEFMVDNGVLTEYDGTDASITIPSNVTVIDDEVFEDNVDLISVTIPANVVEIGSLAFAGCSNLETIELAQGLQVVGDGAFQDCVKIKEIVIPDSVTELGGWTFLGCSSLQSCAIPSQITKFEDSLFQDCISLETINIPENVTIIGDWVFWGCTNLKEAVLPKLLQEIDEGAFQGCTSLKEITLYENVSKIGDFAFENCTSLEKVVIYADNIEIGENVFKGCESTLKFYGNETSSVFSQIKQSGFSCVDLSEYVSDENHNIFQIVVTKTVVTVKQKKITMTKGKKAKIKATSSDGSQISYKSLNKKTVTVTAKGVLKALKTGKAVIEVSSGGTKVKVRVVVKKTGVNSGKTITLSKSLQLSKSKISVKKGTKITIDSDAVSAKVTFSSLNKKIASVSVKGVIKARKKGKTAIVIKVRNKRKKLTVTVK